MHASHTHNELYDVKYYSIVWNKFAACLTVNPALSCVHTHGRQTKLKPGALHRKDYQIKALASVEKTQVRAPMRAHAVDRLRTVNVLDSL